MKEPKSGGVDCKCLQCGNKFIVHPYRAKDAKYCSRSCQFNSMKKGEDKQCIACKKPFYSGKSRNMHYCSRSCYTSAQTGDQSHFYVHGLVNTPENRIWHGMKNRCYNSNDHNYLKYGAKGIKMCDEWFNSFEQFYKDVGPRPSPKHSIDRINVLGNYEPTNVRWATAKEQAVNKRNTLLVTFNGETKPLQTFCDQLGLPYGTILPRIIRSKWSVEKALTTPPGFRDKCNYGHAIPENFYLHKSGIRECYLCMKRRGKEYRDKKRLRKAQSINV